MTYHFRILIFLLLVYPQCFAQVNPGALQVALAHSDISLGSDVFTLFNNPAGLSNLNSRQVGLYYSPAPFGLKELSNAFGAYVEPTSFGSFSGGFMIYGFDLYKETKIAVGYGKNITDKFAIGITSIYKNISIKNYGNKGFFILNIGGIAKINEAINLGFSIENITRTSVGDEDNQIPVVFWGGLGYKATNDLTLFLAVKKELNYNASLRFGSEYKILDFFHLRFGAANEPKNYSGGLGIVYDLIQFDYAIASHSDLGISHQFGLIICFKTN